MLKEGFAYLVPHFGNYLQKGKDERKLENGPWQFAREKMRF